jgi:hypothetical protein
MRWSLLPRAPTSSRVPHATRRSTRPPAYGSLRRLLYGPARAWFPPPHPSDPCAVPRGAQMRPVHGPARPRAGACSTVRPPGACRPSQLVSAVVRTPTAQRPPMTRMCRLQFEAGRQTNSLSRRRSSTLCAAITIAARQPNQLPAPASTTWPLLPFPCSSRNSPQRRRTAQPRCRRPAVCSSERTGGTTPPTSGDAVPSRPRPPPTQARSVAAPGAALRPSPAVAGRGFRRRWGAGRPGTTLQGCSYF